MRGQVFEIEGKTFFTMGGAASHDIQDGILDPAVSDLFQGVNAGGCFSAHTIQTSLEQFCNLLPLNGEAIINLTIPMIVSEKPGLKFTPTFDYLEEISG